MSSVNSIELLLYPLWNHHYELSRWMLEGVSPFLARFHGSRLFSPCHNFEVIPHFPVLRSCRCRSNARASGTGSCGFSASISTKSGCCSTSSLTPSAKPRHLLGQALQFHS